MLIANNASFKLFVSDYNKQNSSLQTSMAKLASGQRMIAPGEAPADLGISERFRAQIRNSDEAGRVIQNGINLFSSSDSWLQQVQNMLGRMSELSISSADGSKNAGDRTNLDLEFQQLKQEVSRISEAGKYNGLQVNGNTSVATYDFVENTIKYTQADGSDERGIGISLKEGNSSKNGIEYNFVGTGNTNGNYVGDFLFSEDGKSVIYYDQDTHDSVMKLDIASDTISSLSLANAGGTTFQSQMQLVTDADGRVWSSHAATSGTASANGGFTVSILDTESMIFDSGGGSGDAWAGGITTASGFGEFAVHDDYVYYVSTNPSSVLLGAQQTIAIGGGATNYQRTTGTISETVNKGDFVLEWTTATGATTLEERVRLSQSIAVTAAPAGTSLQIDTAAGNTIDFDDLVAANNINLPDGFDLTDSNSFEVYGITGNDVRYTYEAGAASANTFSVDTTTNILTFNATTVAADTFQFVVRGLDEGNEYSIDFSDLADTASNVEVHYRPKYNYVKQSLFDTSEVQVLVEDIQMSNETEIDLQIANGTAILNSNYSTPVSTYTVSKDGLYMAWESANGEVTVMNTETELNSVLRVGEGASVNQNTINALEFDSNNNLYWTNTGGTNNQNTINRVNVQFGAKPEFSEISVITNDMVGRLGTENYGATATNMLEQGRGLSVMGGSPAANYTFQVGPDSGMEVEFSTANVELINLGISRLDVLSQENAQVAIKSLANAINTVANERAVIGAQVSRLNFVHTANDSYSNNISQAEARIRDVDFASESAKLAKSQVMAQTATAILAQANLAQQSVLRLLQ